MDAFIGRLSKAVHLHRLLQTNLRLWRWRCIMRCLRSVLVSLVRETGPTRFSNLLGLP